MELKSTVLVVWVLAYCAATTLLLIPLVVNSHLRVTYINTVAHYAAKVHRPKIVLVGDSITAGGAPWGYKLTANPLAAVSLASSGIGLRQIADTFPAALAYRPEFILISGGTNDQVPQPGIVAKMVADALAACVVPVVTIPPWTSSDGKNRQLAPIRERVRQEAEGAAIVTLDELAPQGLLLPQYTSDGLHLSGAAYEVWTRKLRQALNAASAACAGA